MNRLDLQVQHIAQTCYFHLSWGQGQQLAVQVPEPDAVFQSYQTWQHAYRQFYRQFRARPGISGIAGVTGINWRSRLVEAEAHLLNQFHAWINQAALLPIRATIAKAACAPSAAHSPGVDLFLTCAPDLERLPWEAWDLGQEFPLTSPVRLARTPDNIRQPSSPIQQRTKLRILAILGDDTGLNFQAEQLALKQLRTFAEVHFEGYQANQDNRQLRAKIRQAIANPMGWDILFFAGHSNETPLTGGELGIAPGETLALQEIEPDLLAAKQRGLQFAIFNSCQGLKIAQSLINLGFNQVVIMREPIHNQVAQQFFQRFIHHISHDQDAHTAVLSACQDLKDDPNLTYPSSYWIPSMFRHPGAVLPQLRPTGWSAWRQQWLPTRWEVAVLVSLTLLSLLNPVQDALLDRRLLMQAIYRQLTSQVPQNRPPVRLIGIDKDSLDRARIQQRNPLPWGYLAQVLARLAPYQPQVIGIDYLLDKPESQAPEDIVALQKAVRSLVEKHQSRLTFASILDGEQDLGVDPALGISMPTWGKQGYTNSPDWFVPLPRAGQACAMLCPFTTQLAIALSPPTNSTHLPGLLPQQTLPITEVSREFRQFWLQPIFDFSIPPDRIYQRTPAHQLWKPNGLQADIDPKHQVILIAADRYREAGLDDQTQDQSAAPLAVKYWTPANRSSQSVLTGGELNAYAIHHLVQRHLIIPIPDLWLIPVAAVVGKRLTQVKSRHRLPFVLGGMSLLSLLSLQVYVSGSLLVPVVFPSLTIALYLLPSFGRK
jgi:hypothetical protein